MKELIINWCWACWCRCRPCLVLNVWPQLLNVHWFGFSAECILECSTRLYFRQNDFPQFGHSQTNRRPVWVEFLCASRWAFWENLFSQPFQSQRYGFSAAAQQLQLGLDFLPTIFLAFAAFCDSMIACSEWPITEKEYNNCN